MTDNAPILRTILRECIPANMQGQCDAAVTRYFAALGKPGEDETVMAPERCEHISLLAQTVNEVLAVEAAKDATIATLTAQLAEARQGVEAWEERWAVVRGMAIIKSKTNTLYHAAYDSIFRKMDELLPPAPPLPVSEQPEVHVNTRGCDPMDDDAEKLIANIAEQVRENFKKRREASNAK